MIKISKSRIEEKDNETYLIATITIPKEATESWKKFAKTCPSYSYIRDDYHLDDDEIDIWYKVNKKYGKFFCDDRNDGFVAAMILYAMVTGQDIESELPVSKKLLFNFNYILIPTFCNKYSGFKRIYVKATETDEVYKAAIGVGTGMSCGIDSFHTVYSINQDYVPKDYHINCLTFLDTGASHYLPHISQKASLEEINREADRIHRNKCEKAKNVAEEMKVPFIEVRSNLSDLYQGTFGPGQTYRNMSAILNLQKYFKIYYYSTAGYEIDYFEVSLYEDPASAEQLGTPLLSTDSLTVFPGGISRPRYIKTIELANDKIAQNYLNVCNLDENCGHCPKCYRTLITFETLGKLEKFAKVFDLEKYEKNRNKAYLWLAINRKKEHFAKDIYIVAKEKGLIPKSIEIKGEIYRILIKIRDKLKNNSMH